MPGLVVSISVRPSLYGEYAQQWNVWKMYTLGLHSEVKKSIVGETFIWRSCRVWYVSFWCWQLFTGYESSGFYWVHLHYFHESWWLWGESTVIVSIALYNNNYVAIASYGCRPFYWFLHWYTVYLGCWQIMAQEPSARWKHKLFRSGFEQELPIQMGRGIANINKKLLAYVIMVLKSYYSLAVPATLVVRLITELGQLLSQRYRTQ